MPAHIKYETTPIIFYKFVCENPEIKSCYVGQTTNFQQRKCGHKHSYSKEFNKNYNLEIYKIIRDNGGWQNWKMVEINRQLCLDKTDACKLEQQYIEKLQATMNTRNAIFNKREWEILNKDKHTQYHITYRKNNKEKINIEHKQYYIDNKEQMLDYLKQYRFNHKERIHENNNKKFDCECGGKFTHIHEARHFRTKKHIDYLASKIIS